MDRLDSIRSTRLICSDSYFASSNPVCAPLIPPDSPVLPKVGLQKELCWNFPYVLDPLADRLSAAGIETTDGLCEAATGGVLLSK